MSPKAQVTGEVAMKNSSVSSSARRIALTHSFSTSPRPKLKCKRKLEVLFFKIQPNPISQRRLDLNTAHSSLFWFNLELLLSWVFFFLRYSNKRKQRKKAGKDTQAASHIVVEDGQTSNLLWFLLFYISLLS